MQAEIITIGDEILIGQIVDTNSAHICKELNKIGIKVYQITSIQDNKDHILQALKNAKNNADLVIITGGLGPTKDDITKQTLCEFFDDTLREDPKVRTHIEDLFTKYYNKKPLPTNLLQAMIPSKAAVLMNDHGTAPGMWFDEEDTVYVSLPGVPYEMKHLLEDKVLPKTLKRFNRPFIYHKTLLTYGMGESEIANRISDFEDSLPKEIKLAYLPSLGRVRLRLSSTGLDESLLQQAVDAQMKKLEGLLGDIAVGFEDQTNIVERIAAVLTLRKHTLSLAESCTGGAIAEQITAIPGASAYFRGSLVPYETEKKASVLGVDAKLIEKYSVVSAQVAEAMAVECTKLFNSTYALSTTGIAGPTKGDGNDEVGTVYIGIAGPSGVYSEKFSFGNARERVITKATNKAFEMFLKEISKN